MITNQEKITSIEELEPFDDEFVYDLVMKDRTEPFFFANRILVHNSCYFSMEKLVSNIDEAVELADAIIAQVNESFPEFMRTAFLCQPEFDSLIKLNREVVAPSGIFRAKKKYILYVADMEGKRIDPDSPKALKTQGSDIKISSTPETIRQLLKDVTMMVLKGTQKRDVDSHIMKFRRHLNSGNNINPLDYATITSVKNLESYTFAWERTEKVGKGKTNLPGNVRATINYNNIIKELNVQDSQAIMSGSKIKIVWLKENEHGFTNMAFSSDVEELPQWFLDNFEVDIPLTEKKLVDQKIGNIFEPIGWEVPTEHTETVNKLLSFD